MPKEQSIAFRAWTGGEFGNVGLFNAQPGQFHASNLWVSQSGYVYPRHGVEGPYPKTSLPNGVVHALGWTGVVGRDLWILVGNQVWWRDSTNVAAGGWTQATGTPFTAPNEQIGYLETQPGITYLLVPGQGLYKLDVTSSPGTLTVVAGVTAAMAGRGLAVWGTRLFIGGGTTPKRVYYSADGDFSSWNVANYFDVGAGPEVRVLLSQREHLSIALQDGSWYVMTGSTPTTGTLRRVQAPQGRWHFWNNSAALLPDDTIYLVPLQGTWPAQFDGIDVQELPFLEYATVQGTTQGEQNVVGPLHRKADVAFVSGRPTERGAARFFMDHVWTAHSILSPTTGIAGGTASDAQGHVFFHDGGAAGAQANVWRLNVKNDGLPGGAASESRRGDASDTPLDAWVELPGWWDEAGREWLVRQVTVHVRKFNIGGGVNNELDMVVDAHTHEEVADVRSSSTYSFDEATSSGTAGGVRDKIVWNLGEQGPGSGFQVRFPKIVGLAIVSVEVLLEATADQSRS